ncbi:glycosyltransferase [Paenibacillus elgii]|uniref:glycosyltransferase n=1 Tax=Paenibacillus elgii TaxID=189691 RepID=UPI003B427E3C
MLNAWRYQTVHANDQYSVSLLDSLRPLLYPVVVTIHGKYFKPRAIRRASAIAKAIIAVSPPIYHYAIRCGAKPAKVHLVPNGLQLNRSGRKGRNLFA